MVGVRLKSGAMFHAAICHGLGHEVVIIKDGIRACGSGGVLGNAPLVQSKSYFEVKLQQSGNQRLRLYYLLMEHHTLQPTFLLLGIWGVGLATRNANLKATPGGNDPESWVFCYDGVLRHNKKELQGVTKRATEGDIIVSIAPLYSGLETCMCDYTYFLILGRIVRSYRTKFLHQWCLS